MTQPQIMLRADALSRDERDLGWFRIEQFDVTPHKVILFHTGEVDGHTAGMYLAPADKLGVILLQNLGGDDGNRAMDQFGFWLLSLASDELAICGAPRSDTL